MPLHILALLAVIGGIFRAGTTDGGETLKALLMSEYLLWAIFFEIAVLNVKD